jgi:hypothetical protein
MQGLPARVIVPILLGAAGTLALAYGAGPSPPPAVLTGASFVAFYGLLTLAPWLTLRLGVRWWILSFVGSVAGFFLGLLAATVVDRFLACLRPECAPPVPPPFVVLFGVNMAFIGLAQALALNGTTARVVWIFGTLLAGAALGLGIQLSTGQFGLSPLNLYYGPAMVGGVGWGVVTAVTLLVLMRTRATGATPRET